MKQQHLLENTHIDLPFQVGAIWQITLYTIYYYILQSRTFNVFIEMITSSKKTKNMAKCVTIMVFFFRCSGTKIDYIRTHIWNWESKVRTRYNNFLG